MGKKLKAKMIHGLKVYWLSEIQLWTATPEADLQAWLSKQVADVIPCSTCGMPVTTMERTFRMGNKCPACIQDYQRKHNKARNKNRNRDASVVQGRSAQL